MFPRGEDMIEAPEDIIVNMLPGGKVVSIIHKGPYDQLGRTYEKSPRI